MKLNTLIAGKTISILLLGAAILLPSFAQAAWISCGEVLTKYGGVATTYNGQAVYKMPNAGAYTSLMNRNLSWSMNPYKFSNYSVPVYISKKMSVTKGSGWIRCNAKVLTSPRVNAQDLYIFARTTGVFSTCTPNTTSYSQDAGFGCN